MLFGSERKHFSGPVRFSRTSRETLSSVLHPQHPCVEEVPRDGQMSAFGWCLISATVGLGDSVPRKQFPGKMGLFLCMKLEEMEF